MSGLPEFAEMSSSSDTTNMRRRPVEYTQSEQLLFKLMKKTLFIHEPAECGFKSIACFSMLNRLAYSVGVYFKTG